MARHVEDEYREKLRALLARVYPRRLEFGVELLMRRARVRSELQSVALAQALSEVYEATRQRVERREAAMTACGLTSASLPAAAPPEVPRFVCDASLGGLARWLRAAGYEAVALSGASAERALAEAQRTASVLLTSDGEMKKRRVILDRGVAALHVPTALKTEEQLVRVARALGLVRRTPRCMDCGGALRAAPKESVRPRIPPRTALWKDEYFLCAGCGKLFWEGTHWERISKRLDALL